MYNFNFTVHFLNFLHSPKKVEGGQLHDHFFFNFYVNLKFKKKSVATKDGARNPCPPPPMLRACFTFKINVAV